MQQICLVLTGWNCYICRDSPWICILSKNINAFPKVKVSHHTSWKIKSKMFLLNLRPVNFVSVAKTIAFSNKEKRHATFYGKTKDNLYSKEADQWRTKETRKIEITPKAKYSNFAALSVYIQEEIIKSNKIKAWADFLLQLMDVLKGVTVCYIFWRVFTTVSYFLNWISLRSTCTLGQGMNTRKTSQLTDIKNWINTTDYHLV